MLITSTFNCINIKFLSSFRNIVIIRRSITSFRSTLLGCQIRGTSLTVSLEITLTKRFMWSRPRGHANKLLNATNKSPVQSTATTFPANANKIEEELDANRKLPTGIDFSNNSTDQASITQEQHQTSTSTFSGGRGSISQSNSGMLSTQSPRIKTTLNTENTHIRTVAMHGGRLKKNAGPLTNSKGTQPESDTTGKHELVAAAGCSKDGCKEHNCATGTELSTGTPRPNPYGEPPAYHQQAPQIHPIIKLEVAGNLTSKIPAGKQGIVEDSNVQVNNVKKPQEQVTEPYTVTLSPNDWNEKPTTTVYHQTDAHTQAIVNGMPSDSILNQK